MKKLFFDTSALLSIAFEEPSAAAVESLIWSVQNGQNTGLISAISLTELVYSIGKRDKNRAFEFIAYLKKSKLEILDVSQQLFLDAASIRLKYKNKKLSTGDGVILATAIREKADEVVSGDLDWRGIPEITLAKI